MRTIIALLLLLLVATSQAWIPRSTERHSTTVATRLWVQQKKDQSPSSLMDDDEETPAGIAGAEFFGGNRQKEEFYDPVAEAEATIEVDQTFNRFEENTGAFADAKAAAVARDVQTQINRVLYLDQGDSSDVQYTYRSTLDWQTDLPVQATAPLSEMKNALDFYEYVDIAVTSGRCIDEAQIELRWEISLAWPIFWEPRVLLTGKSTLTLADTSITRQVDELDQKDLLGCIYRQIVPRFWDMYHIGMSSSSEMAPRFPLPTWFKSYQVYELPPRLYLQPSQLDSGARTDNTAGMVPNHAFSCVVKTMGPQKERYVPTSPVEVQLAPAEKGLGIQWQIPLAVGFASKDTLAVPQTDEEADMSIDPLCSYEWKPSRRVATVRYGGSPQDEQIAQIRKKLYDQVLKDGLRPKMVNGRPIFFLWMNSVKACYTENGLGMAVYEWRPPAVKPNEVGIELEKD